MQNELNCKSTASIRHLDCIKSGERTPASMGKTDRGRFVYSISHDVTASGGAQDGASRQAEQADGDSEKVRINRYLCHSELKEGVGEIEEDLGDKATRTKKNSKGFCGEKFKLKVSSTDPIHVFTSAEGEIVKVYDECKQGICSCDYSLCGERQKTSQNWTVLLEGNFLRATSK